MAPQPEYLVPVEHSPGTVGRQIPAGSAVDSPAALEIPLVTSPAGLRPLPNQCPLELRRGTQHVQQKPRRRILEIRIQSLGDRDEPDAVLLQDLDVVQAVHQ